MPAAGIATKPLKSPRWGGKYVPHGEIALPVSAECAYCYGYAAAHVGGEPEVFMSIRYSRFSMAMIGCAAAALLFALAVPAEAVTCKSVCNQVRRACNHAAKGSFKAGKIQCTEESETCNSACVDGDEACPSDCDLARDQCRVDNKAARDVLRSSCDDSRTACGEVCVDPIARDCVRGCKTDERDCRADAKRTEGLCKKSCAKDDTRRRCIRSCRKTNSLDEQVCGEVAVLCYAGCAGFDPTPEP